VTSNEAPRRLTLGGMAGKNRYDDHGKPEEQGRYVRSGNYVWTWSERGWALLIGATLIGLVYVFGPVLQQLPYPGVMIYAILAVAVFYALWVPVIGRAHKDQD
jgi:hypothetical protein